ncbi:Aldehyde/histidinol dehydrogenase [Trametes elegans]|nr:Aldehyde/histidinol dehydrogenase [Trametes elegans]
MAPLFSIQNFLGVKSQLDVSNCQRSGRRLENKSVLTTRLRLWCASARESHFVTYTSCSPVPRNRLAIYALYIISQTRWTTGTVITPPPSSLVQKQSLLYRRRRCPPFPMSTTTLSYTPIEDIPKIHQRAATAFLSGKTKSIKFRKAQIAQVGYLLKDNEQRIKDALKLDLGRPELETDLLDFNNAYSDVRMAYDNVEKWARTHRPHFSLNYCAMRPSLKAEPKGTVLIVIPFNFPAFLTTGSLVSAIAAGDAAVVKPSEQTPAFSALIAELLPKYVDNELYHVINGGPEEATKILELRWDHIFYVGSGRVGRIIAEAAAKHLTPLTLELGGKNPVVVDPKCDIKTTARRLLWGRFTNAGQICLCPEYVLVPRTFQDTLVSALEQAYHAFYPEGPAKSASFARIITKAHAERIQKLIAATRGTVVLGGDVDVPTRYVAPTVVKDVKLDDALMADEVFGPVLAIVPIDSIDEALAYINSRDRPLAVYVFSNDKAFQRKVFENTQSGMAMANDTILSAAVPGLPIGGVGGSGYGYYTGKHAFDEFTHLRPFIDNPSWVDTLAFNFRFPPYTPSRLLKLLAPRLPPRPTPKSPSEAKTNGHAKL